MSLSDFFSPLNLKTPAPGEDLYSSQYGSKADLYTGIFPEPAEGAYDIAIIGVPDGRNAVNNAGCAAAPDPIREKFYQLYEGDFRSRIVDLGNIRPGRNVSDTYIALKIAITELIKLNILPVILGGGQDLTYAQYMAYEEIGQKADLLVIDSRFDLREGDEGTIETTSESYLNKIFLHEPNYLFNYSNLGYQTYLVSQDSLRMMEKLYFDVHRVGDLTADIRVAEPVIRNASLISFDVSAIRSSDACGNANAVPNGFSGEEACRICRYAGISDKLSSIGFYEYNPELDQNGQTAMLTAQMLWYLIEGFYQRKKDIPLQPKSQYLIYRASLKQDAHELIFVKSKRTERWWMQVPYPVHVAGNERYHLVPCRYEDYQEALTGNMPDLWWRTYQKLL